MPSRLRFMPLLLMTALIILSASNSMPRAEVGWLVEKVFWWGARLLYAVDCARAGDRVVIKAPFVKSL